MWQGNLGVGRWVGGTGGSYKSVVSEFLLSGVCYTYQWVIDDEEFVKEYW